MIDWLQVRKRPLNKKELSKNEEDIIETESNCLVVYETKLKVCDSIFLCMFKFFFSKKIAIIGLFNVSWL